MSDSLSLSLLDICHGRRMERQFTLFLVFEHIDQDLATYLEQCPPPGLGPDRIKVCLFPATNGESVHVAVSSFSTLFSSLGYYVSAVARC